MNHPFETRYHSLISALKQGRRPLQKYTSQEQAELLRWGETALAENLPEQLRQCLCLLDHAERSNPLYTDFLIEILQDQRNDETVIYALGTSAKHIVALYSSRGEKVPLKFRTALLELLKNKNWELLEWVLRIIEQLGNQTLMFIEPVQSIRPSLWQTLPPPLGNPHARNCRDIIKLLAARWRVFQ